MKIIIDISEDEYKVLKSLKNGDITRPIYHIINGEIIEEQKKDIEGKEE